MTLFVAVARTESFTKAAEKLDMPGSTLSRRISELEASLGVKLFNRTTRRVELTEAGRLYFARCDDIVVAAGAARDELFNSVSQPRGLLRISMSPDFGTAYLSRVIGAFTKRYPEILLQLDLSPRRVDLLLEDFDIAFRVGLPSEPYLVARKVIQSHRRLYASPECLKRHGTPKSPEALKGLPCVIIDNSENRQMWAVKSGSDIRGVEVSGAIAANNPRMALLLAAEGLGIAAADEGLATDLVRAGRLVGVLPDWEVDAPPIYAVTSSRTLPAKVRLFLDFVHAEIESLDKGSTVAEGERATARKGKRR